MRRVCWDGGWQRRRVGTALRGPCLLTSKLTRTATRSRTVVCIMLSLAERGAGNTPDPHMLVSLCPPILARVTAAFPRPPRSYDPLFSRVATLRSVDLYQVARPVSEKGWPVEVGEAESGRHKGEGPSALLLQYLHSNQFLKLVHDLPRHHVCTVSAVSAGSVP